MFGVTRTYVFLVAGYSLLKTFAKFHGRHENRHALTVFITITQRLVNRFVQTQI